MSKNITIKEDGTAKAMSSVSLLNLKLQSGGGSDWVPEDETPLAKIDITHNGEYVASADGYYGYGLVRVNVAGAEQSGTAPSNIDGGYSLSDYTQGEPIDGYTFQTPPAGGVGSSIVGVDTRTGQKVKMTVGRDGRITIQPVEP